MDFVWEAVSSFFLNFRIRDFIDIILISIVIYQVIKLTKQTRAISVMKGLGVLLLAAVFLPDMLTKKPKEEKS